MYSLDMHLLFNRQDLGAEQKVDNNYEKYRSFCLQIFIKNISTTLDFIMFQEEKFKVFGNVLDYFLHTK